MRRGVADFARRLAANGQSGSVQLQKDAAIACLTFCHPAKRNSITGPMMAQLRDAVEELETWKDGAGLIITGEGGEAFCAGADFGLVKRELQTAEDGVLMSALMTETLNRLRSLPLLSIAAIDGPAVGGGAELATCADWRCMSEGASIRFVHARMGASPGWGGAARLAALVGRGAALRLLTGGARLDPAAAASLRLSDLTAAPGESAVEASRQLMRATVEGAASVGALRAIKTAVHCSTDIPAEAREAETEVVRSVWGADMSAFERRPGS
jgi:ethylmalonyl-CoA/methylmalonyl-CoA decarboxylase